MGRSTPLLGLVSPLLDSLISPYRRRFERVRLDDLQRTESLEMPEISRFFGIVVRMYHNDHEPAHFHATYGEFEATFTIATLEIESGFLPRRAVSLVIEWAVEHRRELQLDWELARAGRPLARIEPLG